MPQSNLACSCTEHITFKAQNTIIYFLRYYQLGYNFKMHIFIHVVSFLSHTCRAAKKEQKYANPEGSSQSQFGRASSMPIIHFPTFILRNRVWHFGGSW